MNLIDCYQVKNEYRGNSLAVSYLKKIIIRIDTEVIELRKPGVAYVSYFSTIRCCYIFALSNHLVHQNAGHK